MDDMFKGIFDEMGFNEFGPFIRRYAGARAKNPKEVTSDEARAIIQWDLMKLSAGMANYSKLLAERDIRRAKKPV